MSENSKKPNESGNHLRIDEKAAVNFVDCSKLFGESPVQISERTRALSNDVWETFFDADGRVVNESALRKAVFKGIICCNTTACLNFISHCIANSFNHFTF